MKKSKFSVSRVTAETRGEVIPALMAKKAGTIVSKDSEVRIKVCSSS